MKETLADAVQHISVNEHAQAPPGTQESACFRPASKQEGVAGRLGLAVGTYRHHPTASVERPTAWLWHQEQNTPWFTETPTKLYAPPFDATTEQPGTAAPEPDHSRCMPQDFRLKALGFEKARVMGVGLLSGVIANGRDIRSLDRA